MAVYTKVSRDDLQAFLENYAVGELVSFEAIQAGVENTNYKVITTQGPYILTLFEKRTPVSDVPFVFRFGDHLLQKGIACPVPIANKRDENLSVLCGRPAAIISFLEGRGVEHADITPDLCAQMGAMTAQLHVAAYDFSGDRANSVAFPVWEKLVHQTSKKADSVEVGLQKLIIDELHFLSQEWVVKKNHLPAGVVHADLFPDNIFIEDKKIIGVIDLYFSCKEVFVYDLMLTLGAWCFDQSGIIQTEYQKQFMGAYQKVRPLSDAEIKMLSVAGRAAAFRILMTRLNDYIFHDQLSFVVPKNPIPYANILRHYRG